MRKCRPMFNVSAAYEKLQMQIVLLNIIILDGSSNKNTQYQNLTFLKTLNIF